MLLFASLLAGCLVPNDTSGTDTKLGTDCPLLDCRDSLTLTVLGVDGAASSGFGGQATTAEGETLQFDCWLGNESFDAALCLGDGKVTLWSYAASYTLNLAEGDDAPYFNGELTPAWTAPYDSDECGHYCYLAEELVQLEACEGCG